MPGNISLVDVMAAINKKWDTSFEPLEVDGASYDILSIEDMKAYLDKLAASNAIRQPLRDLPLWAKIWPGSLVLGRFLRKFEPQGKTMLELGCGMGILSLVASAYGFGHITATDVNADAINFCKAHILKNNLADKIDARYLDVASPPDNLPQYDIIAASELLYLDDLHRPLLKFINRQLAPKGKALFCTDLARLKPRFQKLAAKYYPELKIQEGKIGVKSSDADGGAQRRIFSILILEKL